MGSAARLAFGPMPGRSAKTNTRDDLAEPRAATGAMLAGGQSRRMGADKARMKIEIPDRDESTIGRLVLDSLTAAFQEVLVIGGAAMPGPGWRQYADAFPEGGALGGVYTALRRASHEYVFVAACDMPFLSPRAAAAMLDLAIGFDVTIPIVDGKPQTLHAVYRTTCIEPVLAVLESGGRRVIDFYPEVSVRELQAEEFQRLDPGGQSARNINTPDDLARARADFDRA